MSAHQTLTEKIRQRRAQMLVHSYLYYELARPIVSDGRFDRWAMELVELQRKIKRVGFYDRAFKGWTGATGHHLPFDDWVKEKANRLLRYKFEQKRKRRRRRK